MLASNICHVKKMQKVFNEYRIQYFRYIKFVKVKLFFELFWFHELFGLVRFGIAFYLSSKELCVMVVITFMRLCISMYFYFELCSDFLKSTEVRNIFLDGPFKMPSMSSMSGIKLSPNHFKLLRLHLRK